MWGQELRRFKPLSTSEVMGFKKKKRVMLLSVPRKHYPLIVCNVLQWNDNGSDGSYLTILTKQYIISISWIFRNQDARINVPLLSLELFIWYNNHSQKNVNLNFNMRVVKIQTETKYCISFVLIILFSWQENCESYYDKTHSENNPYMNLYCLFISSMK